MHIFVAIDRTSKVAFAELHPQAKRMVAADFLQRVLEKLPHKVHIVLTDNGMQFTPHPHQLLPGGHSFDRIWREDGVAHRINQPTLGPTGRLGASIARLKRRPCSATITSPLPDSTSTCKPFCWLTTMPNACAA